MGSKSDGGKHSKNKDLSTDDISDADRSSFFVDDGDSKAAAKKRQYDQLKKQLASDDVATALDELEQKMRHHEQVRESGTQPHEHRTAHKKQSAT